MISKPTICSGLGRGFPRMAGFSGWVILQIWWSIYLSSFHLGNSLGFFVLAILFEYLGMRCAFHVGVYRIRGVGSMIRMG